MDKLTVNQAAERTGIARSTIVYNIRHGYLPAGRFGNGQKAPYAIDPADLDDWAARRQDRNMTPHRTGLVSLPAAAARLGVTRQWLHWQIVQGRIKAEKYGRYWYLREKTILEQTRPESGPDSGHEFG